MAKAKTSRTQAFVYVRRGVEQARGSDPAAACRRRKWKVAGQFADSGPRSQGLEAAVAAAVAAGGVLVVPSLAHLGRSTLAVLRVVRRLQQAQAHFAAVAEDIDTTQDDRFYRVMAALAGLEVERGRLAQRVPFGFELADDGLHLILCPEEQALVRDMLDMAVRGLTPAQISDALNRRGAVGKAGEPWDAPRVKDVLDHIETSRWAPMDGIPG